MRALRRSLVAPVACGPMGLLVLGGASAEPATITLLHTNDV